MFAYNFRLIGPHILQKQLNYLVDCMEKTTKYSEHMISFTAAARQKIDSFSYKNKFEFLNDLKAAMHIYKSSE